MKNLILLSTLVFSTTTFSATTATLLLQAQVPKIVSISVDSEAVATALDLTTTQTDLKVGVVNEKSNSRTGYKVNVKSANQGKLKRTDGADVFAYTLKVSGYQMDITPVAGTTYSLYNTQLTDTNRDMTVSYTGKPAEQMVEGSYSDTVTFTISAI